MRNAVEGLEWGLILLICITALAMVSIALVAQVEIRRAEARQSAIESGLVQDAAGHWVRPEQSAEPAGQGGEQ